MVSLACHRRSEVSLLLYLRAFSVFGFARPGGRNSTRDISLSLFENRVRDNSHLELLLGENANIRTLLSQPAESNCSRKREREKMKTSASTI